MELLSSNRRRNRSTRYHWCTDSGRKPPQCPRTQRASPPLERRFREPRSVPLPLQLKTEPLPRSNLKAEDVRSQLVGDNEIHPSVALEKTQHRFQTFSSKNNGSISDRNG